MKSIVLVCLIITSAYAQTWLPDKRLTNQIDGSFSPSVAVSGDNIHVVWYDFREGNNEIYYKLSTNNGETWSSDTKLTNDVNWSSWPSVAASGDNIHVVWEDNRDGNYEIYYKRSTDNGETWGSDTRLTNALYTGQFSSIAVSGDTIHVVWEDFRNGIGTGNDEIYYKRSTDNGQTWDPDIRLTDQVPGSYTPSVDVSGDSIHVVWDDKRDGNDEIYYKHSLDNGQTWSSDTRLTNEASYSWWPSVGVSGDSVHVVWQDSRDGGPAIYYKRSLDHGGTWGSDTKLSEQNSAVWPSAIASGNDIHVVWQDSRDGNYEIYYKGSLDNGQTWGTDKRLTNESSLSAWPSVAVSGSNIHVIWQDLRDGNEEIYYKHGSLTGIEEDGAQAMKYNSLSLWFPNPSYNRSAISYSLQEEERIDLSIYDISGSIVRTLIRSEIREPGVYDVIWDGRDDSGRQLPSGIYFCQIRTMQSSVAKNMVFLR